MYEFVVIGDLKIEKYNHVHTSIDKILFRGHKQPMTSTATGAMTLQEWLDLQGMSYSAFARLVPCSPPYPRMIAHGLARPSYAMAKRIEEVTGGCVARSQWYAPEPGYTDGQEIGDLE